MIYHIPHHISLISMMNINDYIYISCQMEMIIIISLYGPLSSATPLDALALAKNTVDLQLLNEIVLIIDLETHMSIYVNLLIMIDIIKLI